MVAMTSNPLDASLRAATGPARYLIVRRLADARAHTLSGSNADARCRLDELTEVLCRHLNDKRTGFCREALGQPHAATEHVARTAAILGRDQHADLRDAIKQAKAELMSLQVFGGSPDQVRNWEGSHGAVITRQIELHLSNSQMALHSALQVIQSREPEPRPIPAMPNSEAGDRIEAMPTVDSRGTLDPAGHRVWMTEFFSAVADGRTEDRLDAIIEVAPSSEWGRLGKVETVAIGALVAARRTLRKAKLISMAADPDVQAQRDGLPTVFPVDGRLVIEDGHHRLAAMAASGHGTARVNVVRA